MIDFWLRHAGEEIKGPPRPTDERLEDQIIPVVTYSVRLVAGVLFDAGHQPQRCRRSLPTEPDIGQVYVAFAADPDRERLVGERRLLVLHRPGPHPDHPGGQCLDVKPNFRQRVSQQAILLVTEAAAPT